MKKRRKEEKKKKKRRMVEHRHYDDCGDPDCCVYQVKCNDPDCDVERVDEKDYYDYVPNQTDRALYEMNFQGRERVLTELNWDDTPPRMDVIDVREVSPMNWGYSDSKKKMSAIRIQRMYLRHYTRRKVAARKITRGCHNWVWKPKCKDGTMGIRPRLDTLALDIK